MSTERGIYLRGGVYWISYGHRGKQYRETTESTSITKARKMRVSRLADLKAGKRPDAEKVTLADLEALVLADYAARRLRSPARVARALKVILCFLGPETRAVDVTTKRLNEYLVSRREAGKADATILQEFAALKRGYSLAIRARELHERPAFPKLEIRNAREGFFEEADLRAILLHLPEYVQAPTQFSYLTGWRTNEVLRLRWEHCDLQAGWVHLPPELSKNKEGRSFPFAVLPPLADLLTEQRARTSALIAATGEDIPWVFHRHGAPIKDFRHVWKGAWERAGIGKKLFHDFRRTAVRNLERAGVPRSVAMKLTGHKTESVYLRYAITTPNDLRDGVAKLAKLHSTITAQSEA